MADIHPTVPPLPRTQALSSNTFKPPPTDGTLSIPEIYDWHYTHTPDHPLFVHSDGSERKTIFWPEAVRAIHTAGRLISSQVHAEPNDEDRPVVAIFSAADTITYFTTIVGVIRAGYAAFPVSPRNSPAAVAHLLSRTRTVHVLVGQEPALRLTLDAAFDILRPDTVFPTTSPAPLFEEMYLNDAPFELLSPFKPRLDSLAFYLHSSGSTAFPKPVPWTHKAWLWQGATCPYFGERDVTGIRMSCHALPMYHGLGVMQTGWIALSGIIMTSASPRSPATAATPQSVYQSALDTQSDLIFCVPSFIEAWARNPEWVMQLAKMKGLLFSGGPLNKTIGDILTQKGVSIFTIYGTSEIGIVSIVLPSAPGMDWEYFKLTKHINVRFIPDSSGQAELVMVPSPYATPRIVNGELDGTEAYYTSDLLTQHPTRPGYWKVYGRMDDQIMHSTGEKTNAGPLESILNQDPQIQSAVMFGRGRLNVGVLIDPKPEYRSDIHDDSRLSEFRNVIWPTVKRMNDYAPQHSRVFKEMIIVSSSDKPFEYTGKNTVRRQAAINLYEPEIDALYDAVAQSTQADVGAPDDWSATSALPFVRTIVRRVLQKDTLEDDVDIFQYGADSLQATWIRNTLLRALRDSARVNTNGVPDALVYEHPTIAALALFAARLASGSGTISQSAEEKVQSMLAMLDKYGASFPMYNSSRPDAASPGDVVLVTGTTGALGARLLADLIVVDTIERIYAVNRPGLPSSSLDKRHAEAFVKQDLPVDILHSPKVVLLEADAGARGLGLSDDLFEELRSSVTHIIHNAWRVDFNLNLTSFEANVRTVRNLIDFALSSSFPTPPRLLFVSSVGVTAASDAAHTVPEGPMAPEAALSNGYSQSKWVAETLLARAAEQTALRPILVRVGQLSGAPNGYWNASDWVPAMIKTSRALGCFPSGGQVVSWLPLGIASRALVEMRNAEQLHLHLVHPQPAPFSVVATTVAKYFSIPLVPYAQWFGRLEERAAVADPADPTTPAVKTIDFFRHMTIATDDDGREVMGIPLLDVTHALAVSETMRVDGQKQLDSEDVEAWLGNWERRGFW